MGWPRAALFPSASWVGDSVPCRGCLCAVPLEEDDAWTPDYSPGCNLLSPNFALSSRGKSWRGVLFLFVQSLSILLPPHMLHLIDPLINLALLLLLVHAGDIHTGNIQATCPQSPS